MSFSGVLDYLANFVKMDATTAAIVAALVSAPVACVALFPSIRKWLLLAVMPGFIRRGALGAVRHITQTCEPNNPDLALKCALEYAHSCTLGLMHVGEEKGALLDELIASNDPSAVLELGAYFGYSAIRMARLLKKPGAKVYSLEISPECTEASRELVRHCGLQDCVEIINEPSGEGIEHFQSRTGIDRVDFVFIDHFKDFYLEDLKRLEALGLLRRGTVIVADNIGFPGVPDYLEYVTSSPAYATTLHPFKLTGAVMKEDTVAVSIFQGHTGLTAVDA